MVRVLLISGSLRRGSSNSASLRTAAALAPQRVSASLYQGLEELPHFNPDEDAEGVQIAAPVARMRSQVGESDAILFCTPEYAGALPGAFKNLLEWNVGSTEIHGLPVASVNVAGPGRGENAEESLRTVLGYIGAELVAEASVRIPDARFDWLRWSAERPRRSAPDHRSAGGARRSREGFRGSPVTRGAEQLLGVAGHRYR